MNGPAGEARGVVGKGAGYKCETYGGAEVDEGQGGGVEFECRIQDGRVSLGLV